ncbi:MAG: class I SAM-dependent methyltransferase [Clostridiales bacterium]|nr:class I SAM-dependent methyltransferase [Clostridiales bacterium]
MDPTKKFNGYAEDYTAGRPGYASALIDWFYSDCGLSRDSVIADIGSGTGKFAVSFLKRGNEVYCVEPNDDMRAEAERELNGFLNFHSVRGGAEDTTLPSCFADLITTAQAFHWFDADKFRSECKRIIKDGGKVALIWNVRDRSDGINRDLYEVFSGYCPDFRGFSGGIKKDDPRIREFFRGRYDHLSFANPLYYDKQKFIARCLSGSYSIKEGETGYDRYMEELVGVFDRYSENGIVTIANDSVAYIGSVGQ